MLYCENCRVSKRLNRPSTFPYHNHYMAECELCKKRMDCYDYPALFAKQDADKTEDEKLLDKRLQQEYHQKAENLVVCYVTGPHAGVVNQTLTDGLKTMIVPYLGSGEIDWYATYELRLQFQKAYRKVETEKENRRTI